MKAKGWTTWKGSSPNSGAVMKTEIFRLCMKPWDLILPEEGIEERLKSPEPFWRTWERYLPGNSTEDTAFLPSESRAEIPEKVLI